MSGDVRVEWGEAPLAQFAEAAPQGSPADEPGPDAEWGIARVRGEPVARCATYTRVDLTGAPGTSGLVGHYAARDAHAGIALLTAAAVRLRERGAQRVLGPMNGSTWARYRLALPAEPGDAQEPPFFGEPVNPPEYPQQFVAAGFRPAALYESRITPDVAAENPRARTAEDAAAARGIAVAPLRLSRFEDELTDLHALSVRAFPENLYYSPIDLESFAAMYRPMRALLDPELVLLARTVDGRLVAYAFAYADPLSLVDGKPHRLVVKTLAADPEWRSLGLGGLLVHRLHAAARQKGLTSVIHALMHVANDSVKISAHTAQVFRRYALFEHGGGGSA